MKSNCPGCGAKFRFSNIPFAGSIPDDIAQRIFTVESPCGMQPVIADIPKPQPINSRILTKMEIMRLSQRFEVEVPSSFSRPAEISGDSLIEDRIHFKKLTCGRCFKLKNYGESQLSVLHRPSVTNLSKEDEILLQRIFLSKPLMLYVVDLVDFPFSFLLHLEKALPIKFDQPIMLIGNKVDLFAGTGRSTLSQASYCLQEYAATSGLNLIGDPLLVSAKTGFNLKELKMKVFDYISKHQNNAVLVGRTNVGKSAIFNSFASSGRVDATVANAHGTTAGILSKGLKSEPVIGDRTFRITKQQRLYDIPGFLHPQQIIASSYPENHDINGQLSEKVIPTKHSLTGSQIGIIPDFCLIRIDQTHQEKIRLDKYMNASILFSKFKRDSFLAQTYSSASNFDGESEFIRIAMDHKLSLAAEVEVKPSSDTRSIFCDVVFNGNVGWLSLGHPQISPAIVRIYTPKGVDIKFRTPPIRQRFLEF